MSLHILISGADALTRASILESLRVLEPDAWFGFAETGAQALEYADRNEALDLAFIDIRMPLMDGIQAARYIQQHRKNCQIIYLAYFGDYESIRGIPDLRTAECLFQPFSQTGMKAAVMKARSRLTFLKDASHEPVAAPAGAQAPGVSALSHAPRRATLQQAEHSQERRRIEQYLSKHCFEHITLARIAADLGYSRTYFCRRFGQLFMQSFISCLTELRLAGARKLLADKSFGIGEIAKRVGFHDANYFSNVFKHEFGCTPTEYRKHITGNPDTDSPCS